MDRAPGETPRPGERRSARLPELLDVIATAVGASTLDGVLDAVVGGAARACGASGAAVVVSAGTRGDATATYAGGSSAELAAVRDTGVSRREGSGESALLAVPIVVADTAIGAIVVTGRADDAVDDSFDAEDEQMLVLIARGVATAADNARLHAELRTQRQWLTATAEIGSQLLVHAGEDPLRLVAKRALELSDADLVVIALVTDDQTAIVIEEALGSTSPDIVGRRYGLHETLAGLSILERRAILSGGGDDFGAHGSHLHTVIDVGPVMAVPLIGTQRVRGAMTVSRTPGRGSFTPSDLTLAAGFATHASVALELGDSRVAEQRVVLLEDRDRIARDLHDHVIQELFAIGLGLQSIATQVGFDSEAGERIGQRVEDLDRTIRRIRTSIFELRGPLGGGQGDGLRQSALEIASDLTPALGFAPNVRFSGPVDLAVDPDLTADLTAVIREALSNVAKHAHASRVTLDVDLPPGEVVVTVCDDGVGPGTSTRSSGTANLRTRAERRGGSFDVNSAPAGGTLLVWRAPVP